MKTYTPEKKQEAIDRFISGESAAAILADIGIPKSTFYNWVRIYQEEQAELNRKTVDIRNFHLLENKVARLETIIEILKSASCTPKSPLKQRLYAAEQLYGEYNIHVICDAFDIPRGTFYNHVLRNKRDNTWYAKRREELRLQIQEIYDESNQIFGAAKIAAVMKSNGIKVSDEMVRTLMRDMGLVSIRQSAKKLYEDECRKYKNHLNQEFDVWLLRKITQPYITSLQSSVHFAVQYIHPARHGWIRSSRYRRARARLTICRPRCRWGDLRGFQRLRPSSVR